MRQYLTALSLLLASTSLHAQTPTFVSPSQRTAVEGSSFTHYPLGRHSARMQTLHDDVPGGTVLNGHGYRRDAITVRGIVDAFDCELQVTLSMSPNTAANAATTFASNVGSNPVVVLPRQTLSFPATDRPPLDPAGTFELQIPYATPFTVPAGGGTVCVDVEVFTNSSGGNLSIYLDAHQHYTDGRAKQPAYRFGVGCPAPGATADCYGRLDLWRLASGTTEVDVDIRDGVPDPGTFTTAAFLMLGHDIDGQPWPWRPDCPFWSTTELWYVLPGSMSMTGSYDGQLQGLPLLPPGYRIWCQAGSIDVAQFTFAFTDALTLITPAYGEQPIPTSRVANANDVAANTGSFSYAVPVMAFW